MAGVKNSVVISELTRSSDENPEKGKSIKKRKSSESKSKQEEVKYNKKFTVPMRKKRKNDYDPEEEARLERLVFGDQTDIINNLLQDDEEDNSKSEIHTPSENFSVDDEIKNTSDSEDKSDDASVTSDSDDDEKSNDSEVDDEDVENEKKAAWIDDDDENAPVEKIFQLQGRKLPAIPVEKTYKELLLKKHKQTIGTPKWAELNKEKTTGSDDELDDEIFRRSSHFITPKVKKLTQGTIEIKALSNINKKTRTEGPLVTSIQFHPTSTVALVAGLSGVLSIFQIDGRENTKLHSMQYKKFPINTAKFTKEGSEIVIGSQMHAHCHAYDLLAGKTHRIPLPHGMTKMKNFEVSPDGKLIAVCGRMGDVHLLSGQTKELVCTMKMNDQCNTLAFSPDSKKLFSHGEGGEIYVWDVNERTCMHRAIDNGCLSGSKIAISPSGQYLATGSKQGVVNVYDTNTVLGNRTPTPLKIVLNLVTSISSLKFNPTSEILAMASDEMQNAFKMMHLPSATIFSNFPTFGTDLRKPVAVDFSPGSGYLGISNNARIAYLYRLKHYGNY